MRGRAFLSATFVPGSGHLVLGRTGRGLLVAAAMTALLVSIPWLRMVAVAGLVLVWLGQLVDVLLVAERAERRPGIGAWLALVIAMGATGTATRLGYLEAFRIPSGGMLPTIEVGEHLFVFKLRKSPRRGDLVAFRYPKDPGKIFLQRVVGVGGDHVRVDGDGVVFVNDAPVPQENARDCTLTDFDEHIDRWRIIHATCLDERLGDHRYTVSRIADGSGVGRDETTVVPDGHVYVLGDSRNRSHDSRFWGTVPAENLVGEPIFIWWSASWGRIGKSLTD